MTLDEYNNTKSSEEDGSNRFVSVAARYVINGDTYDVYYDSVTKIVYLSAARVYGNNLTVLLGSTGKSQTIDEFETTN